MFALSRFTSELWMLFREMSGLVAVAFVVFALLGLWFMRSILSKRTEMAFSGIGQQGRLMDAAVALREGIETPELISRAAVPSTAQRQSGRGSAVPKVVGEPEPEAKAGHAEEGEAVSENHRSKKPGKKLGEQISQREKKRVEVPALSSYSPAADVFSGEDGIEIDRALGIVFGKRPECVDDLKRIRAIDARIEGGLNRAGVYRIAQIALWTRFNAESFGTRLRLKGKIARERWISQAKRLIEADPMDKGMSKEPEATPDLGIPLPTKTEYAKALSAFPKEPVEIDQRFGVVFPHRPSVVDDLTEIDGIRATTAAKLNGSGIYRFAQIAHWNAHNVSECNLRHRLKGRIVREKWVLQAKKLAARAARDGEKYGDLIKKNFAGECVAVRPDFGIVYLDDPKEGEDLALLGGLDAASFAKLRKMGVYRFKQIAIWKDANAKAADRLLGLKPGSAGKWRVEARKLADQAEESGRNQASEYYRKAALEKYQGEDIEVDDALGILFKNRPERVDDLTRIKGIAEVLGARLNELGIYRFGQIALWNRFTVNAFSKRLKSFQDRMYRDRWIEQAAELDRNDSDQI